MGLLDFFLGDERNIQRHTRRITNRDAQPDDREASARWLAQNGSPKAILGLLQRFDMNLEHQLKDQGEKELVHDLVLPMGEKAVEALRAWLRQCRQFTQPLRLLGEIQGHEAAVAMVYELLELELKKDDFKPDKKKGLLVWLAEVRHTGVIAAASPFLTDFDEGVRYAAAEAILAQGGEPARKALLAVLSNPNEESNRLKIRVADQFVQRGWRADELTDGAHLPERYTLREGRIVQAG